jgi:hypothetical protein
LTPAAANSDRFGHDDQAVQKSGGGDQTVFDRHGLAGSSQPGEQLRPLQAGLDFPWDAMQSLYAAVEPPFPVSSLLSFRQQQNTEAQFAHDNRIDRQVLLVRAQPVDDARIR